MTREEAVRRVSDKVSGMRFQWGVMDCCQVAREMYRTLHGVDPAPELTYQTEDEARAIIEAHGGLSGLMTHLLGSSIPTEEALTGDILRSDLPHVGEIIGLKVPCGTLVPISRGLFKADLRYSLEAWRI